MSKVAKPSFPTLIPEPLSGPEVIEAVAYRANEIIREVLRRDCFLSANSAYEAFECKIMVHIKARDCGRVVEVKQDMAVGDGIIKDTDVNVVQEESGAMFSEAPPNVVRAETEQPVPVMTADSTGNLERKTVKYKKRETEKV